MSWIVMLDEYLGRYSCVYEPSSYVPARDERFDRFRVAGDEVLTWDSVSGEYVRLGPLVSRPADWKSGQDEAKALNDALEVLRS